MRRPKRNHKHKTLKKKTNKKTNKNRRKINWSKLAINCSSSRQNKFKTKKRHRKRRARRRKVKIRKKSRRFKLNLLSQAVARQEKWCHSLRKRAQISLNLLLPNLNLSSNLSLLIRPKKMKIRKHLNKQRIMSKQFRKSKSSNRNQWTQSILFSNNKAQRKLKTIHF